MIVVKSFTDSIECLQYKYFKDVITFCLFDSPIVVNRA